MISFYSLFPAVSYHSVPMPPIWRPATQPHHHSSLLSNSFSINHFLLTFCLDPYISQHCAFKYALINVMNNESIGNVRFYWFVALFSDHSHWWEDIMLGVGWGWCAKQIGDKLGCEGVCMVDGCVWGGRWCLIWFSVSNDDLCAQKESNGGIWIDGRVVLWNISSLQCVRSGKRQMCGEKMIVVGRGWYGLDRSWVGGGITGWLGVSGGSGGQTKLSRLEEVGSRRQPDPVADCWSTLGEGEVKAMKIRMKTYNDDGYGWRWFFPDLE